MNNQKPLISIVVPAYNCAQYVEETFRCVQQQDLQEWEIIFVNDGSTDSTAEVLARLAAEDTRVKVIEQPNGRQGKARNNGISHAQGEWVAFLDADDLWPPNKLSFQLSKTIQARADVSYTDGYICLNNNMDLREHRFGVKDVRYQGTQAIKAFHEQNRVPTSSVLAKKKMLLEAGGFPEQLNVQNCEDYLFWVKLLLKDALFLGISEPLLYYRVHPDSSTSSEINALFPVIHALLQMPGNDTEERRLHLKQKFEQLVFRLNELGQLEKAKEITLPVIHSAYSGWNGFLLKTAWMFGAGIFIRVLWRLRQTATK